MITDYRFNTTDSPVAKLIISFMDEISYDIQARGKSLRNRNLIKNYFNKRGINASGLNRSERNIFLSGNPNHLCDRLCLISQEKQAGNDTNKFDNEILALIDNLLEYM